VPYLRAPPMSKYLLTLHDLWEHEGVAGREWRRWLVPNALVLCSAQDPRQPERPSEPHLFAAPTRRKREWRKDAQPPCRP